MICLTQCDKYFISSVFQKTKRVCVCIERQRERVQERGEEIDIERGKVILRNLAHVTVLIQVQNLPSRPACWRSKGAVQINLVQLL